MYIVVFLLFVPYTRPRHFVPYTCPLTPVWKLYLTRSRKETFRTTLLSISLVHRIGVYIGFFLPPWIISEPSQQ